MGNQLKVLLYFVWNNLRKAFFDFPFAELNIPEICQNLLNALIAFLQHMQAGIFQLLTKNNFIGNNFYCIFGRNGNQ